MKEELILDQGITARLAAEMLLELGHIDEQGNLTESGMALKNYVEIGNTKYDKI